MHRAQEELVTVHGQCPLFPGMTEGVIKTAYELLFQLLSPNSHGVKSNGPGSLVYL